MSKKYYRTAIRINTAWFEKNVEDYPYFSRRLDEKLKGRFGEDYRPIDLFPAGISCVIASEGTEEELDEEIRKLAMIPDLPAEAMTIRMAVRPGFAGDSKSTGDSGAAGSAGTETSRSGGEPSRDEVRRLLREKQEELRRKEEEKARKAAEEELKSAEERRLEKIRASALEDIDDLVGAEEFKALCRELDLELPVIQKNGSLSVFRKTCFLFSIDDGSGLSHAAQLFSNFLASRGVLKSEEYQGEFVLPEPNSKETEAQLKQLWERVCGAAGRDCIFVLDISRWTGRSGTKVFRRFLLNFVRSWPAGLLVIRIPALPARQFRTVYENLSDIFFVRTVTFPPFGKKEQHELAGKIFSGYGFKPDESLWPVFDGKMEAEAADGITHGIHTYRKVVQEMILAAQRSPLFRARQNPITGEMVRSVLTSFLPPEEGDPAAELEGLVGLGEVKTLIPVIAKQIELSRNSWKGGASLHMRFDGNPGTGKTTVARILGRLLAQKGILKRSQIVEKMGRDLCGIYIGETARITRSVCEEAYGTILFIDEAYSLHRGKMDSNDFGREAMDVLITEMENHRDDLIVILAGYEEEMDHMFTGNPGLKSRVSYHVHFPNYTREELAEIFRNMMEQDGVQAGEGLFEAAGKFFSGIPEQAFRARDFGNARLVRNIYQQAYGIAAVRLDVGRMEDIVISPEDFKKACEICRRQIPGMEKGGEGTRIGFID